MVGRSLLDDHRRPLCVRVSSAVSTMTFAYLATPYTYYKGGLEKAYHDARMIVAGFAREGHTVFSPIVYWHPVSRVSGLDPTTDQDFWLTLDKPFMEAASELIVVKLPGWEMSKGVCFEIEYFEEAGKPIHYYEKPVFE